MSAERDLPQTDTLGPSDVRWLQSEFRATREAQVAGTSAVMTRLGEHHERILQLEGARHSHATVSRRKRIGIVSTLGAVLGIIGTIAAYWPK